jgi:hypothetical protein
MAALKSIAVRLAGLASVAGGVVVAGHLAPVLVILIAVLAALSLLVILPAVYGSEEKQRAARTLLRILLGRRR